MISCGCAAGIKHVTAACVTGGNPERLVRIPDLTGFPKTEVIIPTRSRNQYDAAIHNIGVTVVNVNTAEEMEKAINSKTAMIYLMSNLHYDDAPFPLEQMVKIAKPFNVPILVDAAAEDLVVQPNPYLQKGADVVAYSGGKAIHGPQNAGLLLGKKDLLLAAWQAIAPHHGPCRDNKVSKETAMAMLAAVEAWVNRDHEATERMWNTWLENIGKRVSAINGVTYTITPPRGLDNRSASLRISWDPEVFNITGTEVSNEVFSTKPRIALSGTAIDNNGMTSVSMGSRLMLPGEDKIVADRLFEILSRKNEKKPPARVMDAPSANISGRWDVDIDFYNSKGRHSFFIEQNGNNLIGAHQGEFTTRNITGTLDGNRIRLSSSERHNSQSVPFTFTGTAANDAIEGDLAMGEYLAAKFTAKRYVQPQTTGGRS
jgi:seryl-tRNA(Sec) selenium transferase